jgi:hypothetical protein
VMESDWASVAQQLLRRHCICTPAGSANGRTHDAAAHFVCSAFSYNENADEGSITASLTGSTQALSRAFSNAGGLVASVIPGEGAKRRFKSLFHRKKGDKRHAQ